MRSASSLSFLGSAGRGVVRESNRTLGCCLSRTAELNDRPTVAPRAWWSARERVIDLVVNNLADMVEVKVEEGQDGMDRRSAGEVSLFGFRSLVGVVNLAVAAEIVGRV